MRELPPICAKAGMSGAGNLYIICPTESFAYLDKITPLDSGLL